MLGFLAGVPGKLASVLTTVSSILDHLGENLSADRSVLIDRLDATVSSRAPATSALSNAIWTNARASMLDGMFRIKSIQRGVVFAGGGTSVTITAVNPANSVVSLLGASGSAGPVEILRVELTNATTVTCWSSPFASSVGWQVVEYY